MYESIKNQAKSAVEELLAVAQVKKGGLFVVGCSSSEILGNVIGKGGSLDAAGACSWK